MTPEQNLDQEKALLPAADELSDQARSLARDLANQRVVFAPTLYELACTLKGTLSSLADTLGILARTLPRSLDQAELPITDRDPVTGEIRDAIESVQAARGHLTEARHMLRDAALALDTVQADINGQGWTAEDRPL